MESAWRSMKYEIPMHTVETLSKIDYLLTAYLAIKLNLAYIARLS